ncbi:hypothetical protein Cantr_06755 [Candida viswanathii]|uniref:Uncharacterized protein n=1 Tax=Candida viswanathii TaxID=5486 RepID=A0A367XV38_9ASCO|nr:hypothetical protein Cantr_06755 [Candida viswanathii]
MYKPKFQFKPNTKSLVITKPVIDIAASFNRLTDYQPSDQSSLLSTSGSTNYAASIYTIKDNPYLTPELDYRDYVALLRRNFKNISYNTKREVILGEPPLTEQELEERLKNTLAFVFNHTVAAANPHANDPVYTSDDLDKISTDNDETKIVGTILRLDNEFPPELKYDFKFKWITELNRQLDAVDWEKGPMAKDFTYPLEYIGYKLYLITLMRLNESLKTCL